MSKTIPEDFRKILGQLARRKSDLLTVYKDFCRMAACSLALQSREEEYLEVAKGYTKEELQEIAQAFAGLVSEMEVNPFVDILGVYYMEVGAKSVRESRGEFFTPKPVCTAMAKMLVDVDQVISEGKPITVSDPACGSGGIPLAIAELFIPDHVDLLRITCQDISALSCDMCYINMTLWGIPAKIIWGDTLCMTVNKVWCNLHWHRVGEDKRELFHQIGKLLSSPDKTTEETSNDNSQDTQVVIPEGRARNQLSFDF